MSKSGYIQPAPVPMNVTVNPVVLTVNDRQQALVSISFTTHQGTSTFFFPATQARDIAEALVREAVRAQSGTLIVPENVSLPEFNGFGKDA